MKSFHLLLIAGLLLTCLPIGAAQAYETTAIIEYFSNDGCGPCAGQHAPIINMLSNYTRDEIAFMIYHVSWPSPSDPYYTRNVSENSGRRNYYGFNSVPWFISMGTVTANPLSGVLPHAVSQIGTYTPYQIEIEPLQEVDGTIPVTATVTCDEATQGDMRFNLILLDKIDIFPPGSNGVDDYRYNMLDMAYTHTGQSFTSNGGGEEIVFEHTFDIPAGWEFGNMSVISFIQNYSTGEMFQARQVNSPEVNFYGTVVHAVTGEPIEGATVIRNGDEETLELTGEDGGFAYTGLGAGDYYFSITADGMESINTPTQFYDFGTYELDMPMSNEHQAIDMVGAVATPDGVATAVAVEGNFAYTAAGYAGLVISDVSDPNAPSTVASVDFTNPANDVAVAGNYAYVSLDDGFAMVDISDPANPVLDTELTLTSDAKGLDISGNHLYLAASGLGLQVYDISGGNLTLVSSTDSPGYARDVVVEGDYAFMADGANGLTVWDITNPASPVVVGGYNTNGYSNGLDVEGNYAFMGDDSNGLVIINITNPADPQLVNDAVTTGRAKHVDVVGTVAVIASHLDGVRAYDVSNPNNVVELGYSLTPGTSADLRVYGNHAYAGDDDHMLIFDLTDVFGGAPASLSLTGVQTEIPANGGTLAYEVDFAYNLPNPTPGVAYWSMVTGPGGDTVGPLTMQQFTAMPGMTANVQVSHQVPGWAPAGAYTMTGYVGFYPNGLLMDSFSFNKAGNNADALDLTGWTTEGGFDIAEDGQGQTVSVPEQYELASVYPNPFNPATTVHVSLPEAADLTVAVYNVMGQQVASLADGRMTAGKHAFTFNASHLASGLYFVRAQVPGELNAVQKVMLVR